MIFIIRIINLLIQLFTLLLIIKVLLSYFMDPYHPVRLKIDQFFEPLLAPIRRIVPATGMLDWSPVILLILVQIVGWIITSILFSVIK